MSDDRPDAILEAFETLKALNEGMKENLPDRAWMFEPMMKYFDLFMKAKQRGRPTVWHFLTLPQEPLRAIDVAVSAPEYIGGVFAMLGLAEKYFDLAAEKMPAHICTLNRFRVGLCLSGDTPIPDLMLYAATNPCDAGLITYSVLEQLYKDMPFFCIDIPHKMNSRAIKYVGEQIKEMVSFIEDRLNLKMDMDRLREFIAYSNKTLDYQQKLFELQKCKPCPAPSTAHILHGYANFGLPGVPEMVDWYDRQYQWIKGRAERGEGAVADEKIRLVWIANNIDFDMTVHEWLELEYGAVSVACAMGFFSMQPIDPDLDERGLYEGLALRTMEYPMPMNGRGSADDYIKRSIQLAKDYNA
ncbi:MAG: 2-hydroxyacyl-CoA dehydratase, partial [Candidatus Lindowbacteria bacterium]|nr:2-hydroxyacyl-CoA dehydratase [Candidatus Lindowbacteria bacterium]